MRYFTKGLLFTLVATFSVVSANAQFLGGKKVLVTIGNEKVTNDEFIKVYEKNNTQENIYDSAAVAEYLNLYINFKLKVLEAEALKMDTIPSFIKELDGYRTQLAKPYFVDETVNEQLLNEAYSRLTKDIRASHILIMADENASPDDTLAAYNKIVKIREEVLAGKDFAEAAVEYSDDPSARDREAIPNQQRFKAGNKGDLGYFTVFNMVYPFESAAYNTKVNEISPIVREDSVRKAEKINNIYSKIQDGMSFEDAVVEYSEDKGSSKNQGKLSKFSSNRVVPQFVEVVNSLEVGEISAPISTAYGLHIIKLVSIDRPGTFEEESPKLKERLAKDQRSRKSEDAVIAHIKAENKFKTYPKEIAAIFAAIDSTVLQKKFVADSLLNMNKTVIKLKKDKYTQYDFAKFVQDNRIYGQKFGKSIS